MYFCLVSFEQDFFQTLQLSSIDFESMALKLFRHQALNVPVYRQFLSHLKIRPNEITNTAQIPFLPVSFFKSHQIISEGSAPSFGFTSSTTTGGIPSQHFVPDLNIYQWSFTQGFNQFYYSSKYFCVLALLPNYLERSGSSLVYMAQNFIDGSKFKNSNFYLYDFKALHQQLLENEKNEIPTLLLGVTYALLDFAAEFPVPLKHTVVMETGGMKGKREEMQRSEIHRELEQAFQVTSIHSEYGMTELLSQAYSKGKGIFNCPPWMRVVAADLHDPLSQLAAAKAGSLNIIDLANIYSCAFIATDDLGVVHKDGSFEVLGRKDHSDIRGCGLMYQPS